MNRRFFCALLMLVLALSPAAAIAAREDGFVRLHVVAEGDSDWEQYVKLRVRDACLETARELLHDCASADAAWEALTENLPQFRQSALDAAKQHGFEGVVRLELGAFEFPDRLYGEAFLPAGEYRALRVTLGAGEGHNWWCVLYPSLCVLDEQAYGQMDEGIEFHSSVWRFLSGLFGGD